MPVTDITLTRGVKANIIRIGLHLYYVSPHMVHYFQGYSYKKMHTSRSNHKETFSKSKLRYSLPNNYPVLKNMSKSWKTQPFSIKNIIWTVGNIWIKYNITVKFLILLIVLRLLMRTPMFLGNFYTEKFGDKEESSLWLILRQFRKNESKWVRERKEKTRW